MNSDKLSHLAEPLTPAARNLRALLFIAAGLLIIIAAQAPVIVEYIEWGEEDPLSRFIGLSMGLLAGTLIVLQFVLAARLKFLDRVFGVNSLFNVHRFVGATAAVCALMHPLFLFERLPDMGTGPISSKQWTLLVGAALLISLWSAAGFSLWRKFAGLPFHLWWLMHKFGAFAMTAMLFVHVYFVGAGVLEKSILLPVWIAGLLGYLALLVYVKLIKPRRLAAAPFIVRSSWSPGSDARAVEIVSKDGTLPAYMPGQFAFLRFRGKEIGSEEHPFTISSSPTRKDALAFTIRCDGDWTQEAAAIEAGDDVIVDGPYGLFSHLVHGTKAEEILFIAGGIGVTPMLSMLRFMRDTHEKRPVTLIWSLRKLEEAVYLDELQSMKQTMPMFQLVTVASRGEGLADVVGRLDREKLEKLTENISKKAAVFLCGPPQMIESMRRDLKGLGFAGNRIHSEEFSL
jgi:predicted ferric reductase